MANKRMFSCDVVESERFLLELHPSAQCLFFHLCMNSDDEGYCHSPRLIMRNCGASMDDFTALVSNGFVIPFDSGVCLIRHWFVCNYKDRSKMNATLRTQEKALVELVDNIYELKENIMSTNRENRVVEDIFSIDDRTGEVILQGSLVHDSVYKNSQVEEELQEGKPTAVSNNLTAIEYQKRCALEEELTKFREKQKAKANNIPQ